MFNPFTGKKDAEISLLKAEIEKLSNEVLELRLHNEKYSKLKNLDDEVDSRKLKLNKLSESLAKIEGDHKIRLSEIAAIETEKVKKEIEQLNELVNEKHAIIFEKREEIKNLKTDYYKILVEETAKKNQQIKKVQDQLIELNSQYTDSLRVFKSLSTEIAKYESKIEIAEYGISKPIFDFERSDDYRNEQERIIELQRNMVENGTAAICRVEWTVDGSVVKGRSATKRYIKLALRAFNGESNSLVSKIKWNNFNQIQDRIKKSFEVINKLGESQHVIISSEYFELKMKEATLEYEYRLKKQQEKEAMRAIQDENREEEKAKRDFEKAQKEAEKEEAFYQKAIQKVREEMITSSGLEFEKLQQQVIGLSAQLQSVMDRKERAMSMAQQTKRGHVYIISNIGSFGEGVYKIGMTRRLDPMDRVRELGDASVPFQFDVHALIFSDEARTLEYELHKLFSNDKLNLLNYRKEFFRVSLEQIEDAVRKIGVNAEFTKIPEAMQYRESIFILENKKSSEQKGIVDNSIYQQFPNSLITT